MPLGIQLLIASLIGGALGFFYRLAQGRARPARPDTGWKMNCASKSPSANRNWRNCAANSPKPATRAPRRKPDRRRRKNCVDRTDARCRTKALADLREAFKALSADALKQTAPEFLRLAEQTFGKFQETAKGDLAQRQEAIKGLVEPLKQQLEDLSKALAAERDRAGVHAWAR